MAGGTAEQATMVHDARLPLRRGAQPVEFIEHPSEIPLQVRARSGPGTPLEDPGLGGVRFIAAEAIPPGTLVELHTKLGGAAVTLQGMIVACMQRGAETRLEMAFLDRDSAFEGRMYEQACHIEAYRLRKAAQGRRLSLEQAAREWIDHYSASFPGLARCG